MNRKKKKIFVFPFFFFSLSIFIEFGAGITYGYGHPLAGELGVGPGTYPEGKGHWDNPGGWWYAHGQHSYGNPPAMAMVAARDAMVADITTIAREVFGTA